MPTPPLLAERPAFARRHTVTLKLLFFAALAAVMYFTRGVDWYAHEIESRAGAGVPQ